MLSFLSINFISSPITNQKYKALRQENTTAPNDILDYDRTRHAHLQTHRARQDASSQPNPSATFSMITRHHCSTALLSFLASLVIATTTTYPPLDKINLLVNSLSTQCQSDTACEIIVTAAPPCVDAHCACVLQYHASNCIRECERSSDAVNLFNDYLDACLTASLALPTATQTVYGGSCEPISSATGADGAPGSSGGTIYTMSEAVPTQVGAVQSFAGQLGGTIYTLENDPSTQAEALPTSAGQLGGTDLSQGTIYTNGNGQDETSLIPSGTQGAGFVQCSCSTAGLETGEETGARPGGPIYAMGETGVSTLNGASRTNQSPTGAMAGSAPVLTTYPGPADLLPSVKRPELNTTTNATTTQAVALNSTNSFFGSAIPEECVVPCQAWKDQADVSLSALFPRYHKVRARRY